MDSGFAGKKARYIYGGAAMHPTRNVPVQAVAKYDLESGDLRLWSRSARYFMSEPQFIPRRQSEDPGVVPLLRPDAGPHSDSASTSTSSAESASALISDSDAGSDSPTAVPLKAVGHVEADPAAAGVQEDDGWILAVGFDAEQQQSEVVLLDAADIEAGPIAMLPLQTSVGYGIHGTWVPAYCGP